MMLTDFLRDHAFAIAWLGVMTAAWLGWSQEDPRPSLRGWLGAGSVVGFLLAGAFGVIVWRQWNTATALEGRYWAFGGIVLAEVVAIGVGCALLARRGAQRWYGWWIGVCVSAHFIPLAWIFSDWSYLALAAVQLAGLVWMRPMLAREAYPTSRWACPWMGATMLVYALASAVIFLARHGFPLAS